MNSEETVANKSEQVAQKPPKSSRLFAFIKKNTVMCIALAAAVITAFFVPPDAQYLGYFDFKTLTCLFCVLAVVCALRNIKFFTILARKIVILFHNTRMTILGLIYITFIGSMLIANDMALLTFLPLGYYVLTETKKEKYMAITFILQNIGANLGGMVTPFGNPQNLYLYSYFHIPTGEFVGIMLFPFLMSIVLITVCCLLIPKEDMQLQPGVLDFNRERTAIYLVLFALSIAIVFHGVPYWVGLVVIPIAIFFLDANALARVDYPLLFTFVFFFILSGNLSRIPQVEAFFGGLLAKNTLLVSIASCQVISNVPSAILLSKFTEDYVSLLRGVNIGGTGTLIASLASLITLREYTHRNPGKAWYYIGLFTLMNLLFLAVLTVFCMLIH